MSEASIMRGLRYRLFQTHRSRWVVPGLAALGVLLMLSLIIVRSSAAHPAQRNAAVTLTFTVTITGGTAPTDAVFWLCPDAQANGTGCDQMNGQGNGPYTYQLATTSDTTYHHLIIEWTDGRQPNSSGPLPQPPVHTACSYPNVVVGTLGTDSFSCSVDFTASTVTPTPLISPTAQVTPTDTPSSTTPGSSDTNSTLVTGLQVVIGVGLVLLVILLIILAFQRLGGRRR